jgi:hypothetical protein
MARSELHAILDSLPEGAWNELSANPGWTNGQLLFHILLGFILVPSLFWLIRLFSHLPDAFSRVFARMLNASTPLFNRINAVGPRIGAHIFSRQRLGRQYDRVHRAILKKIDSVGPDEWTRGMHYPTRWDPRFDDYMNFERLFRYPMIHFRHHRAQLRID